MKFKVTLSQKLDENVPVTCVGWSNTEEVYSISEDGQILSWTVSNNVPTKVAQLPKDMFAIDMQILPRVGSSLGKHGDLILITSADGKFHIMNLTGRIERSVEAHKGAVLVGQWSNDGAGLLTAGEDGIIKIWSKSGMLRSTVVNSDNSVYSACWSPDSQSIAYTQGKCVVIKHLAPNTKPLKWKAHEGLVLCTAWSAASDLIVSGGEDCKYRVWDSQGRPIFSSVHHDHHITSIAWAPAGDLFAVGSYNTLRFCDYLGWSISLEKIKSGSIYKMSWSNDSTQLAGACANGHVFFAHAGRDAWYYNYRAIVREKKLVTVENIQDKTIENLEMPERVIQMAIRYSHLVLTTPTQCYIYSTNNWNTPFIFDLKDGSVIHLELAEKHMLLIEKNTVGVYNYQGKLIGQPRWPNMRLDYLRASLVSLSNDTLVVRDLNDTRCIHIVDLSSNRNANESTITIQHTSPIIKVALDYQGPAASRTVALLDKSKDLFIVQIRKSSNTFSKLGRKIDCFKWNAKSNILAAIQDAQLIVWYCPTATFDSKLLHLCSFQYDSPELGRNPRIDDFVNISVSIRRADGSLINVPTSPFPMMIHKEVQDNNWEEALDICRGINSNMTWACLAVLATQSSSDTMDIAEEAFAHIGQYEKVQYIQHIKSLPSKAEQKSHMALLGGKLEEAESILLHNGMVFAAIYLNITMHNWARALDLAVKHKAHIDTVLYLRQKYLESLGKSENINKFTSLKETITLDPDKIEQKIASEQKMKLNP